MNAIDWPTIGYWTGVLIAGGLSLWLLYLGLWRGRSRGRRRCPKCWYDMSGSPSRECPECGHEAKHEKRLFKCRRRWRWVAVALLLGVLIWHSFDVRKRVMHGDAWYLAAVPTTGYIVALPWLEDDTFEYGYERVIAHRVDSYWAWQRYLILVGADKTTQSHTDSRFRSGFRLAAHIGGDSNRSLDILVRALTYPDISVQIVAWNELDMAGENVTSVVPDIHRIYIDENSWVTIVYAEGRLGSLGPAQFGPVKDRALCDLFDRAFSLNEVDARPWSDLILHEFLRRDSAFCNEHLLDHLERVLQTTDPIPLNFLIAARRIEGKPDPIQLKVIGDSTRVCEPGRLPAISVAINHVDEASNLIGIGGEISNRGQQLPTWRASLKDTTGREIETLEVRRISWSYLNEISPNADRVVHIELSTQFEPLSPGRYQLVFYRHSHVEICGYDAPMYTRRLLDNRPNLDTADFEAMANLIVLSTDPITLVVEGNGKN